MQADGEFGARRRARDQFGQHFGQMAAICKIGFAKPDASVVGNAAKCSAAQALVALVHRRALGAFLAWPSFLVLLPMSSARSTHRTHRTRLHRSRTLFPTRSRHQSRRSRNSRSRTRTRTAKTVTATTKFEPDPASRRFLDGRHPEWCARLSRGGFHVRGQHQE